MLALTVQRNATAYCSKVDQYKRSICCVEVAGVDVGLRQLQTGLAWHYKQFAMEQPEAERLQCAAEVDACTAGRRGLWGDKGPVAPWEWRQAAKFEGGPPAKTS